MKSDVLRSRQKMPTAAKAVGAVVLALCAYALADVLMFRFPTLGSAGVNPIFFATIGFCFGWAKIGPAAEVGYRASWRAGIGAAIAGAFTVAVMGAMYHIYRGMTYHAYKTVDDMLTGFMKKFMEYMLYLVDPYVISILLAAGLLAGVFSGFAARLWR